MCSVHFCRGKDYANQQYSPSLSCTPRSDEDCTTLICNTLHYTADPSFGFGGIALCCTYTLYNEQQYTAPYYTHSTALNCTTLHWTSMNCIALHCRTPQQIALHCMPLHRNIYHCTELTCGLTLEHPQGVGIVGIVGTAGIVWIKFCRPEPRPTTPSVLVVI